MSIRRRLMPASSAWMELHCGHRRWTAPELALVRAHYPDRKKLAAVLPHRTFNACAVQWYRRWPTGSIRPWTAAEISRLRRLYPVASWSEVQQAFPRRTGNAIRYQACKLRLYRPTYPFKLSGNVIVDTVKLRARAEGLSMRFLDLEAASGQYFRSTSRSGHVRTSAIEKALTILGGRLEFVWEK